MTSVTSRCPRVPKTYVILHCTNSSGVLPRQDATDGVTEVPSSHLHRRHRRRRHRHHRRHRRRRRRRRARRLSSAPFNYLGVTAIYVGRQSLYHQLTAVSIMQARHPLWALGRRLPRPGRRRTAAGCRRVPPGAAGWVPGVYRGAGRPRNVDTQS